MKIYGRRHGIKHALRLLLTTAGVASATWGGATIVHSGLLQAKDSARPLYLDRAGATDEARVDAKSSLDAERDGKDQREAR